MQHSRKHPRLYEPSWRPFRTLRTDFHQVESFGTSWVLSLRGPWTKTWHEIRTNGASSTKITLTHGRKEI